jgi:hypothetical protein
MQVLKLSFQKKKNYARMLVITSPILKIRFDVSQVSGFNSNVTQENTKNKGIEIGLEHSVRTENFEWSLNANFTLRTVVL